jgi:nitrite reductase/ring-hydroxylating ferredoxin subunit
VAKYVVAPVDELPPGTRRQVRVGGRAVAVFNVDGTFYALRDVCPHQGAALSGGTLVGAVRATQPGCYEYEGGRKLIRCPWHGWEYDLETGQSWYDPVKDRVKSFAVSVEAGAELVQGEPGESGPQPGPYVAETFPISIEDDYVVIDA